MSFFVGVVVASLLPAFAAKYVDKILHPVLGVAILGGVLATFLFVFYELLAGKFFGAARGKLDAVMATLASGIRAESAGNREEAAAHFSAAVREAFAYLSLSSAIRLALTVALGSAAFGATLLGWHILSEQTALLREQNREVAEQSRALQKQLEVESNRDREARFRDDFAKVVSGDDGEYFAALESLRRTGRDADLAGLLARLAASSEGNAACRAVETMIRFPLARTERFDVAIPPHLPGTHQNRGSIRIDELLRKDADIATGTRGLYRLNCVDPRRSQSIVRLHDADLRGIDLGFAVLDGVDLAGSNLTGTTIARGSAQKANFMSALMKQSYLTQTDFTDADLNSVLALDARFESVNLTGANLRWSQMGGFQHGTMITDSNLDFSDWRGAAAAYITIKGTSLRGVLIDPDALQKSPTLRSALKGLPSICGRSTDAVACRDALRLGMTAPKWCRSDVGAIVDTGEAGASPPRPCPRGIFED